jgi:alpha-galactosidase
MKNSAYILSLNFTFLEEFDLRLLSEIKYSRLVKDLKASGIVPGIWLAPFAADKNSYISRINPNWILRKKGWKWLYANSSNCGKWFCALDVSNPEVQVK